MIQSTKYLQNGQYEILKNNYISVCEYKGGGQLLNIGDIISIFNGEISIAQLNGIPILKSGKYFYISNINDLLKINLTNNNNL